MIRLTDIMKEAKTPNVFDSKLKELEADIKELEDKKAKLEKIRDKILSKRDDVDKKLEDAVKTISKMKNVKEASFNSKGSLVIYFKEKVRYSVSDIVSDIKNKTGLVFGKTDTNGRHSYDSFDRLTLNFSNSYINSLLANKRK